MPDLTQAPVVDPHFCGFPIRASTEMPEGRIVVAQDWGRDADSKIAFAGPLTLWRLRHPGREPLLSRHCRGLRELERDRRRYPRPVEPA